MFIQEFSPSQITVLDNYSNQITQKMVDFLNTFDTDKLLFNFRLTAGIPNTKAKSSYSGWENTRIGGHTLGHYLAAAAQAIARGYGNCKCKDGISLTQRFENLLDGLEECQNILGTGFIFGATMADATKPELQFDKVESDNASDTWVPWYTFHKIMNGLVEGYKSAKSEKALQIAQKFGEWAYSRTKKWNFETQKKVLSIEYGGMNDCMYELYKYSKKSGYENAEHFLFVAHSFDEIELYENVDSITNRHANTTIPKFVGAINRYITLAEEGKIESQYLNYAKNFWDLVINHHTYITGGNSECEHFGLPDILDAERSNTNNETCNTHNMLKLSRMLFQATGDAKYADYYENTYLNAIMASVNGDNGMTAYFQPMATGCFKTFCNIDVNKNYFWCCTGTGLENFTKLGDSYYFYNDETLFVNMYSSSKVYWQEKGVTFTQKTDLPLKDKIFAEINFDEKSTCDNSHSKNSSSHNENFTIALRIPSWVSGDVECCLNGEKLLCKNENGFLLLNRTWKNGDKIEITLPMTIKAFSLPDSATKTYGFKYGPLVLAAELGRDSEMTLRQVGVQCDVSANKIISGIRMELPGNYGGTNNLRPLESEIIQVKNEISVPAFMKNITSHFERQEGTLNFILHDTDWLGDFIFSPYYKINNQRYGIYWIFVSNEADKIKEKMIAFKGENEDNRIFIEGIGIGYGAQTEGNDTTYPFMQEKNSVSDPNELTRYAKEDGYFSYIFKLQPGAKNFLVCTFAKEDNGKGIRITSVNATMSKENSCCENEVLPLDETKIASVVLDYQGEQEKYELSFEIPENLAKNSEIRICFSGIDGKESAKLYSPTKTVCEK